MPKIFSIIFLALFLLTLLIAIGGSDIGHLYMQYDVGWVNDHLLLKNYVDTGKVFTGGTLSIDNYRKINQAFGNIFSYFEMPADTDGSLVSLKGVGRLFLKAPIFFFVGETLFFAVWKTVSMVLIGGSFLLIMRHRGVTVSLIGVLSFIYFGSYFAFDMEFGCLFFTVAAFILFLQKKHKFYLFLYFLFGLYTSVMRTDFFLFYSFTNLFLFGYFLLQKRYTSFFWVTVLSIFLLSATLILNYQYYGGFLKFGYSLQKEGNLGGLNITTSFFGKFLFFILPNGAHIFGSMGKFWYVVSSYLGIGIIIAFLSGIKELTLTKKDVPKLIFSGWILIVIFYGFLYYGSNPWNYAPDDPLISSYNRYFSTFIGLFWLVFYKRGIFSGRVLKIFYCSTLLILMISHQHFFYQFERKKSLISYYSHIVSLIPKNAVILPVIPSAFSLLDYQTLEPSGADKDEYNNFLSGLTKESNFLHNVSDYIVRLDKEVYIVGYASEKRTALLNYFENKGYFIRQNLYFLTVREHY